MPQNTALTELKKQLKDQTVSGLYLLYGEETFLKDLYIRRLLDAVPDMGFADFNHLILEGRSCTPSEIDDAIDSFPMMTDRKVVLIRDSGAFKAPSEELKKYFQNRLKKIPEDTVVIFDESAVDKRSAVFKAASKEGLLVEFSYLSDSDTVTWVIRECLNAGVKMDRRDAEYFVSLCDPGLSNANNELQKLIGSGRNPIGRTDIDRIVSKSLQVRVFELTDCLMEKNTTRAITLLEDLKTVREPAFKILYLLFSAVDKMLHAKLLLQAGESYEVISKSLGIAPFIARKYIAGAKGFSEERLENMTARVCEIDLSIKQGLCDEWAALEGYVYASLAE